MSLRAELIEVLESEEEDERHGPSRSNTDPGKGGP
jgi:hypothetical protein